MIRRFSALLAALALASAPAYAQVAQTGYVTGHTLEPVTIYDQGCNAGAGGIVGQTYSGTLCTGTVNGGPTNSAVKSFQLTCATSATVFSTAQFTQGFVILAGAANMGTVFIGGSDVNTTVGAGGKGYPLAAGQPISYGAQNSNLAYYVCQNTTDTFAVTGS